MKVNFIFDGHPFLVEYYWDDKGKFNLVSMEHEYPSLMKAWLSQTAGGKKTVERFEREAQAAAEKTEYDQWLDTLDAQSREEAEHDGIEGAAFGRWTARTTKTV